MQTKHWQHAIAKYTDAISGYTIVPPAFAAVLHCNRAAAYQGAGQHAEAIADSLRSRALDPSYCKVWNTASCLTQCCCNGVNAQLSLELGKHMSGHVSG